MPKTPYYSRMIRLITAGKFTHDTVRTFECGQYNYFIQKIEDEEDTLYCLFIDIKPKSIFGKIYCLYIDEYLESVVGILQIHQLGFCSNKIKQIEDCVTGDTIKVKFVDEEDEEEDEEDDEEEEMPESSSFALDLTDLLSEEGSKELFGLILKELDKEIERREKKNLSKLDKDDVEEKEEDNEESDILSSQD